MNTSKGIALKLGSILLFTIMAACVKYGLESVPTGEAVFFRSFFAIPPILGWAIWQGKLTEAFRVRNRFAHVNRGLFGVASMTAGFVALGLLPLPEAIAIGYAAPLIATALAALMLGEQVRAFRWTAVFVGLFGVLVMVWPRLTVLTSGDLSDDQALGAWVALLGAFVVALTTIHIRKLTRTETTLSIVFWFSVICTVASLTTIPFGWVFPDTFTLLILVAAGLLGGIAQIMMTEGYRHADASTLAPLDYSSMVYGLAIGYLVFAEIPGVSVLVGACIVIAAGILIIWREHRLGIDRAKARSVKTPQG
jgi:drug/metabolite transporter (DMT)-like permease